MNGRLIASDRHIHLNGGFQPGRIYEYVYVVADPVVAGLGLAAVRGFASYAKRDPGAITAAARVLAKGISQDGRLLRDFLYQGFNAEYVARYTSALDDLVKRRWILADDRPALLARARQEWAEATG